MRNFLKKFKETTTLLAAIFILIIVLPSAVNAQASLTLDANFHTISVIAPFSTTPSSVTAEYKRSGETTWRSYDSRLVYIDTRPTFAGRGANYLQNTARFKIFGLSPNTTYDVRITFDGSTILTGQITTLNTTPPAPSLRIIYVDPVNGNDSNSGLSPLSPKRTLGTQYPSNSGALGIAQAGDVIWLKPGTHTLSSTSRIMRDGTPENWVRITKWEGESGDAIVEGNFSGDLIMIQASYIRIDNLTIRECTGACIALGAYPNPEAWRWIDNNIITDWNINDGASENAGIAGWNNPERTIIVNNYFKRRDVVSGNQAGNGYTIFMKNQATYWPIPWGGRHIVWNNTIIGGFDCIGDQGETDLRGGWYINSDIYDNTISQCMDDAFQLDGAAVNSAAFNNTISDVFEGHSINPIIVGPAYVFRNKAWDLKYKGGPWPAPGGNGYKFGSNSDGMIYIMHESTYVYTPPTGTGNGFVQTDSGLANFWIRNSAVQASWYVVYFDVKAGDGGIMSTDYNSLYSSPVASYGFIRWWSTYYTTLAAYRAGTGNEINGKSQNMVTNDWTDATNGDFTLRSGSPLIDAGMVINGINNDVENATWNYKGLAPDIGAVEYDSGAPPSFNFSVSMSPSSATITQGQSATATTTASLTSGTPQSVIFLVSGLSSGASASFSPTSCNPNCTSILTLTTTPTAATGTFSLTITGTGDGLTRTANYSLTVNQVPSPTFTISNITPLYLFRDQTNTLSVTGSNFDLSTDFYLSFVSATTTVSSITTQAQSNTIFNISITSTQVNTLPIGFYDLRLERSTDNQSQTYSQQMLVTVLGDVSSQTAGTRDGKVDIYDVSRMLSKWGSTLPADLAEADINPGPGNISQNIIDLYDANKMMVNWLP